MNSERAWYLLALQLSEEASADELAELNELLKQYPELGLRVETMRNIWRSRQQQPPVSNTNFDKHLQRLSNHLGAPVLQFEEEEGTPVKRMSRTWWWIAASVAAIAVIAILIAIPQPKKASPSLASNTITTRPGSKSKVELPDGTQVWLNADSKLIYNQSFNDSGREVKLIGEAYFDVTPATNSSGKRIPFIIHTNTIDIKVLGTAFNVRSYPNEKTTETALIHGSVEVTLHNSPDKKIILKPNEKLVVKNDDTVAINNTVVDSPAYAEPVMTLSKMRPFKGDTSGNYETMWVKNKLAFQNESFDRMIAELERWYSVRIIVKNEALNEWHFTGVFENKSVNEVLEALSISRKFQYEVRDNQVLIW